MIVKYFELKKKNLEKIKFFLLHGKNKGLIEETIEVLVNGQVTSHWEYDEASNSVIFHDEHIPDEGQTITINYATWGCGE